MKDKTVMNFALVLLAACASGCGGGDSPPQYSIGGRVTGLAAGSALVLTNEGQDALTVTSSGAFAFAKSLPAASAYSVSISSQPDTSTARSTRERA